LRERREGEEGEGRGGDNPKMPSFQGQKLQISVRIEVKAERKLLACPLPVSWA
jgi:hypothetical protein